MTAFLLLRRRPSAALAAIAAAPAAASPALDLSKSHPALYPGPASRAQAEAGNYKKRRVAFHGLQIRVENEAGTVREGAGWATRMLYPYGEVEDTEGVDGDRVDCYLGPFLEDATHVFVVHQRRAGRWDEYDEDKCMLGFLTEEDAAIAYLQHYDDPRFLGPITAMPVAEFVAKVRATRGAPAMVKGTWFGDADLLKATTKKMIQVPGYYKADGTYVPPHQKMVHYNPDHSFAAIAQGGVSHSQKQAHKKLASEDWFHKLLVDEQAAHVMALATEIQDAASASAAVSGWKAAAKAGKNPSAAQWAAFNALPKDKQAALYDDAKKAGSLAHLKPPVQTMEAGESVVAADKLGPGLRATVDKKMAAEPDGGKYYLQSLIDNPGAFEAVKAYAKKKLAELNASSAPPDAAGMPAYDYVAMNTGAKYSPMDLAHAWMAANPGHGKGAELSEALQSLGYPDLAASMDLPAPDSDEDGSAGQAAYDAAHGLDFSGQGADPGPKDGDTKPGADGATLVFKDGRWHKQGAPMGLAGVSASEYLAENKGGVSGAQLGTEWLKENPGKLADLHAAMMAHGFTQSHFEQAVQGASTFVPAAKVDPQIDEFKKEADLAYADGNHLGLQALADEGVHGYPEVAAHAQQHLENLKAKDQLEQIPKSGSFYQKEAYKELVAKVDQWDSLPPVAKLLAVQTLYKQKQGAASQSAAVSQWKKSLLAGKVPTPAQQKAYVSLAISDYSKAAALTAQVVEAIGQDMASKLLQQANGMLPTPDVFKPESAPAATPASAAKANGEAIDQSTTKPVAPTPAPKADDSELMALAKQHGLLGGSGVKSAINLYNAGKLDELKTVKANLSHVKKNMHAFLSALIFKLMDKNAAAINAAAAKAVAPAKPSMSTVTAPKSFYTNTTNGHNKQWAVHVVGNKMVTEYGPIGKTQQKTEKVFASPQAAHAAAVKLTNEKTAAGYKHLKTDHGHQVAIESPLGQPSSDMAAINAVAAAKPASTMDPLGEPLPAGTLYTEAHPKTGKPAIAQLLPTGDTMLIGFNTDTDHLSLSVLTPSGKMVAQKAEKHKDGAADWIVQHGGTVTLAHHLDALIAASVKASLGTDAGPQEGDMKQGADGTLVFKNGRWHKLNKEAPKVKLSKANVHAEVKAVVPSLVGVNPNTKNTILQAKGYAVSGEYDYLLAMHSVVSKTAKLPKTSAAVSALVSAMKAAGAKPSVPDPALLEKLDNAINSAAPDKNVLGAFFVAQVEVAKAAALKGDMATVDAIYAKVAHTTHTKAAVLAIMAVMGGKKPAAAGNQTFTPVQPPAATPAPTTAPSDAAPVVPKMAPAGAVKPGEPGSMKGWVQTGPQAGSNPGGKFKDKNGQEWYVKFPESADIAKNELLASKFYQMLGVQVPFLKLVEKDGKVGVASKWNPGVKKGSAASLAAAEGAHEGFVFDAWLANWDAVGPDFMNMQLAGGKAVRVDVGGSLLYRAQGGKKTDFGDEVLELESLLDASKNSATASTFKGMSKKALGAGLQKLNMLKPSQIEELCEKIGPGSNAEKKKLAATLIARRAFILKKYGVKDQWAAVKALDPTKLPVNAKDLPKPLDFFTINGGKPKSSKAWKNEQNNKVSADLIAFAAKGDLVALKDYKYAEITDNDAGTPTGKMKSIVEHPSKDIQEQWVGLVELLQSIATPSIPTLEMPSMGAVGALDEISDFVGSFSPTERPETVATEHRMGFFMALGQIEDIHGLLAGMKWSFIQKGGSWTQKMKAGFASLSALTRKYISSVQASGSINHAWSQGKSEAAGTPLQKLTAEIYKNAVDIPEGTVLRRGMSDTTAGHSMTKQLLNAKPGLVIQNTDSMCTSFNEQHSWGGDVQMTIRCAKGCKATPSFASGSYSGEYEITTLPGARFVVLGVEKAGSGVKLDVLMLPPHEGFVAEVNKLAKLGKALQSVFLILRRVF